MLRPVKVNGYEAISWFLLCFLYFYVGLPYLKKKKKITVIGQCIA